MPSTAIREWRIEVMKIEIPIGENTRMVALVVAIGKVQSLLIERMLLIKTDNVKEIMAIATLVNTEIIQIEVSTERIRIEENITIILIVGVTAIVVIAAPLTIHLLLTIHHQLLLKGNLMAEEAEGLIMVVVVATEAEAAIVAAEVAAVAEVVEAADAEAMAAVEEEVDNRSSIILHQKF